MTSAAAHGKEGSDFRALGFRVRYRVSTSGFRVLGVWGFGFRALGFRVFEFGV